jgi:murein DD-endopeptidase MepM/ murein hydrolase activator NlpD
MKRFFRMMVQLPLLVASALLSASGFAQMPVETRSPVDGVTLEGRFIQGGMVLGRCKRVCTVVLEGDVVTTDVDHGFVLGFGRDAPSRQRLQVTFDNQAQPVLAILDIRQRDYRIERIKGVPQSTVEPPESLQQRLLREQALVENARKIFTSSDAHRKAVIWPVEGRVSGVFGSQRVYNDIPKTPHNGFDIAAPTGTLVKAPLDGVVTLAEKDLFFSGGTLIVDHGHGIFSTFIHLSELLVQPGDTIRQGEPIAKVGMTGRATGPHLHWSLNWFAERLDPQLLLPPR